MNKAYELAKAEVGTVEWRDGNNPRVVAYFKDAGHAWVKDDETAWCAAFMGAMLKRAGMKGTGELTARSYLEWGEPVDLADAREGDVLIFKRGKSSWQGHVTFFKRRAGSFIECLGGNQSDQVKVSRYPVSDLLGVRRAAGGAQKPVAPPAPPPLVLTPALNTHAEPVATPPRPLSWLGRFLSFVRDYVERNKT
jgi:uncharacterized protein (TIGR02594 family)